MEARPTSWFEQTAAAICASIVQGRFEEAHRRAEPWAAAVRSQFGGETLYAAYADMLEGVILTGLGRMPEAKRVLLAALDTRKRLAGDSSADYAESLRALARWYFQAGQVADARALLQCANDVLAQLTAPAADAVAAFAAELGHAWQTEVEQLTQGANLQDALAAARDWLEWERRRCGSGQPALVVPLVALGRLHVHVGDYFLGEHFLTRAERILEAASEGHRAEGARVSCLLGELALLCGRLQEARRRLESALGAFRVDADRHGADIQQSERLLANLAQAEAGASVPSLANPVQRRRHFDREIELRRGPRLPAELPSPSVLRTRGTDDLLYRANDHHSRRERQSAEALYRLAMREEEREDRPDSPTSISLRCGLGSLLQTGGDLAAAEMCYVRAVESARAKGSRYAALLATCLSNLGGLMTEKGDLAAAEQHLREAIELREKGDGADAANLASTLINYAELRRRQGDLDGAIAAAERAVGIRRRAVGDNNATLFRPLCNLGVYLLQRQRRAEAETVLREALTIGTPHHGADHPEMASLLRLLADAGIGTGP